MIRNTICLLILPFFLIINPPPNYAQKGHYIFPYSLYQYSSISNRDDYFTRDNLLNFENTYHFSFGIQYINNSTDIFGIETGLKYSISGQKYSGHISYDANTKSDTQLDYNSEVIMKFVHVPFLFRFNSPLDEDRVFLTIAAGFQADILHKTDVITNPAPEIPSGGELDYNNLFSSLNISFVSNAMFTFSITEKMQASLGFQMARSIGDAENKQFEFDKTIHPVEYYFPVSTKKEERKVIDPNSGGGRPSSKITNYGLLFGLAYLIKS
ncbi:MAG: hypothetical protein ISR55_11500 [Bacteroidetes bacterium]|nr:hypothetical protein [Bacteroidota bacterium]